MNTEKVTANEKNFFSRSVMPEIHIADHCVAGIGIDLHGVFVVVGVLKLNPVDVYGFKDAPRVTKMTMGIIDIVLFGGILEISTSTF